MSEIPADLRYTKEHEWVRVEGDEAVIGITQFAADQLGDVVFVELPDTGRALDQFATFGVVESVTVKLTVIAWPAVPVPFAALKGATTSVWLPSEGVHGL